MEVFSRPATGGWAKELEPTLEPEAKRMSGDEIGP